MSWLGLYALVVGSFPLIGGFVVLLVQQFQASLRKRREGQQDPYSVANVVARVEQERTRRAPRWPRVDLDLRVMRDERPTERMPTVQQQLNMRTSEKGSMMAGLPTTTDGMVPDGIHADAAELLTELRRRKWVLYVFGPQDGPDVVAAVFQWSTCADVLILRGEDDASAYRVPTFPDTDVFSPELVSWQYHAPITWTLRAVLTIDPPGHPGAPMAILQPAPGCFVPMDVRRPVTIRPTSLGKAPGW